MKSVSNKIVRIAPGTSGVSSFNGRVGAVSPASNDYTINQIQNASELANSANTDIINPTNGQALYYNGSKWYNETPPGFSVNSVFSRVGDITAQNGDYSISQITNASELANSANINVSTKATNDYLAYNGSQWINKSPAFYTNIVQTTGAPFTAQFGYIYHTYSEHITIPNCAGSDLGKRILFTGSHILDFSIDLFLRNTTGPFSIATGNGGIELICVGTNSYDYVSMSGQYVNTATNKKFIVASATDLSDTAISSPSTGQALIFNGTNWANSSITYPVNSVFGRTGTVVSATNDYAITQIQNASTLANSSNVSINLPAINQYLKYNGSQWVNDNPAFYLTFDGYSNTNFTPSLQSINYAPGSTATMPSCGLSDIGKRLMFITANGQNTSITFPTGIQLYEFDGGHQNFTIFSSYGTIELIVSGSNIYSVVACSGAFLNPANNKPITPKTVDALYDTNLTSLAINDYITYNGSRWVNTKHEMYIYLNSNANLTSNQYLQQTGQTGTLERGEFTFPKAGVISKIHVSLDVAPGGGGTRVFTVIVEGVASTMTGSISGASTNLDITTNNVVFSAGTDIALLHTKTGFPNASVAYAYIEYYFTTL